ncbi:MAG: DUF742 domain-containing protein [Labedaea sp.]
MGNKTTQVGRTGARFGSIGSQSPPASGPPPVADPRHGGDAPPGRPSRHARRDDTRFSEPTIRYDRPATGGPRREVGDAAVHGRVSGQPRDAERPAGPVGRTGARFGPYSQRWGREYEDGVAGAAEVGLPAREDAAGPDLLGRRADVHPARRGEDELALESEVLIRPYARTGGRTRPAGDLAVEALISTRPGRGDDLSSWERRRIVGLCVRPRSVAEVAALLAIPLGVARVLLVDMVTDGLVTVHGGGAGGSHSPDLVLMRRVLSGLRRL